MYKIILQFSSQLLYPQSIFNSKYTISELQYTYACLTSKYIILEFFITSAHITTYVCVYVHTFAMFVILSFYCTQIKYKRTALLQCPVVEEFRMRKWKRFGMPVFIFSFILYSLFLFILTAAILVGPFPQGNMCNGTYIYNMKLRIR